MARAFKTYDFSRHGFDFSRARWIRAGLRAKKTYALPFRRQGFHRSRGHARLVTGVRRRAELCRLYIYCHTTPPPCVRGARRRRRKPSSPHAMPAGQCR